MLVLTSSAAVAGLRGDLTSRVLGRRLHLPQHESVLLAVDAQREPGALRVDPIICRPRTCTA